VPMGEKGEASRVCSNRLGGGSIGALELGFVLHGGTDAEG
jgi:hypothetical protein